MKNPIFTSLEYHIVESCQKLLVRTCAFALDWNARAKKLECTASKRKWATTILYLLSCVLMVMHTGNGLRDLLLAMADSRLKDASTSASTGNVNILKHGFQFVYTFILPAFTVILVWNAFFWRDRDENINAFNQLLAYGRKNGFVQQPTKRAKYFAYFYKGYWGAVILAVIVLKMAGIGILISKKNYVSMIPVILYMPIYMYVSTMFLAFHQSLIYVFLVTCHEELTPNQKKWTNTHTLLEATQNYRTLILLSNLFNRSLCQGFVPVGKYSFCGVGMLLFGLAIHVQPTDMAAVVVKVFCFTTPLYMWSATLIAGNMMSSVWYLGKAYLRNLEDHTRASGEIDAESKKLLLKNIRSLSPIRVQVGGLYYMEREAKLTLMNFIAVGTVNMLLVLSNK